MKKFFFLFIFIFLSTTISLAQNNNFSDKDIVQKFKALKSNLSLINILYKPASDSGNLKSKVSYNAGENWIIEKYRSTIIDLNMKEVPYFIKQTWLLVKYYDFNFLPHFKTLNERLIYFGINKNDFNTEKWVDEVNCINDSKKEIKRWTVPPEQYQASDEYFKRNYSKAIELYKITIEKWLKELPPEDPDEQENYFTIKSMYLAIAYSQSCECYFYLSKYDFFSNMLFQLEKHLVEYNEHITYPMSFLSYLRVMQGEIFLWHNNDYKAAITLANKFFNEVENGGSYTLNANRATCQELFYECYKYNGDIKNSIEAAEKQKKYIFLFYPPDTQYDNYRNIAEAFLTCQIAIVKGSNYRNAYTQLKSSIATLNNIFPSTYEHVKQYDQTLIPHSKTLEIDSDASTFLLKEKGELINIVCNYKLPDSEKRVMNFYDYKLLLEIFKQGSPDEIIHTETIKIDNPTNLEPRSYTFAWDGFVDGEYIDYNVTTKVKYFSTNLYYPSSGTLPQKNDNEENSADKLISEVEYTVFKSPVWIDENRSTKYFNVASKELCEFTLYYKAYNIDNEASPIKLDLVLHIYNDAGDEILTHSLDMNETLFMWNGLNSYNELVPWGKYRFLISIDNLPQFNQPKEFKAIGVYVKLKSVTFIPKNPQDIIFSDDYFVSQKYFSKNHWPGDKTYGAYPALYIKNSIIKVGTTIEIISLFDDLDTSALCVSGTTTEKMIVENLVESQTKPGCFKTEKNLIFEKVADKIDFIPEYEINWKVSFNNGQNWVLVGKSINPIYVSYASPSNVYPLRTVVHHSCINGKKAYQENKNPTKFEIIDSVFNTFESKKIYKLTLDGKKSNLLYFYKNWMIQNPGIEPPCSYKSTFYLLKFCDGDCYMWQHFFSDTINVQGLGDCVSKSIIKRKLTKAEDVSIKEGFCIKSWKNVGVQSVANVNSFNNFFPDGYKKKYKFLNFSENITTSNKANYNWKYIELYRDKNPDSTTFDYLGQGHSKKTSSFPLATFENHAIVKLYLTEKDNTVKLLYYDPSYGKKFRSIQEFQSNAVSHFYMTPKSKNLKIKKIEVKGQWTFPKDVIETNDVFIFGSIEDVGNILKIENMN